MSRSRKQKPSTPETGTIKPEYIDENGILRLPVAQYWRWRALDREIRLHLVTSQKAKMQFDAIVNKNPELLALRRVMDDARRDMNIAIKDYEAFKKEVEVDTNLNLRSCTIDDISGRIVVVDKNLPTAPNLNA